MVYIFYVYIEYKFQKQLCHKSHVVFSLTAMALEEGTPLYNAVIEGQTAELRKLLDTDANPSVRDSKGRCLLHVAAQAKVSADILKELLAFIDPTIRDADGNTVAEIVQANKQTDMEKVLKSHVKELVQDVMVSKLERMLLSGWDMWPVNQEDIQNSEEKKKFLSSLPDFQVSTICILSLICTRSLTTLVLYSQLFC